MIRKSKRTEPVLWTSILWGTAASLCAALAGCGILAAMVSGEKLEETAIGYGIMPIMILAAYIGSYTACKMVRKKHLMVSLLTGAVFLAALLLITALAFEAKYAAVGETILLILCGNILCAMWALRTKTGKRSRKRKTANR